MQGQTGIAKKVYECVPISEPWRSFRCSPRSAT